MPGRGQGYVLDVQANLLAQLKTRVVVPLTPDTASMPRIDTLNPVFEVNGTAHVMLTQAIATVPVRDLAKPVASLDRHQDEITRALDILLTGH